MTDDRDFWLATTDWLDAGSDRTPPPAIDAVLLAIKTTRQQRALRSPWRPIDMSFLAKAAIAAAAVITIAVAWFSLSPQSHSPGATPAPTATASPSPTPRPLTGADPVSLETGIRYVSSGQFPVPISFAAPAGWTGKVGGPYAVWLGPNDGDIVNFHIFDRLYADPCHPEQGLVPLAPGLSPDDLANALASLPGVSATTPSHGILDGYPATLLTLTAPDSTTCTGDEFKLWRLPLGADMGIRFGGQMRIWVVEIDGHQVVINAVHGPGDRDGLSAEIQGLIDSIQIEP
jgi:hypothetical protein